MPDKNRNRIIQLENQAELCTGYSCLCLKLMRVIGLDISRGKAAACLLDRDPLGSDYIDLFHSLDIHELPADARGINFLLELNLDAIAMEPTGVHYAKLWANVASERGIPIYWIGHKQLARFREDSDS